jgi:prepilin-type N-terminal cleavage/methylation domain-containing protein/prepilin-type processing-associated H-X9-DG protein
MANSSRRHLGFTLVELLVVITIIGMLVALLLPAVHMVRERGRQLTCLNNIKNISLAAINHESSKGQFPGFSQLVKRSQNEYADLGYDPAQRKFRVVTSGFSNRLGGFSWAAVLMPKLERNDIWEGIVNPPDKDVPVLLPPIATLVCPSDQEVSAQPDVAGLSYSANCGGWDRDSSGNFLYKPATQVGDTVENGLFFDLAEYERKGIKGPVMRMNLKDGAGTTLMFAENNNKTYFDANNKPLFGWMAGTEQQLGIVWVVPTNGRVPPAPDPGNTINDQERISGNEGQLVDFNPSMPRFARPGSGHGSGANVAFCDGHGMFLRDDIDYIVYVQLMTPEGRKAVNPANKADNGPAMTAFRNAPPLAEKDYN